MGKRSIFVLILVFALFVPFRSQGAVSRDGEMVMSAEELAQRDEHLCRSTDEYIQTLNYLRRGQDLQLPEHTARLIADKVSRGCNGAAARFSQVLALMKSVGVSDTRALETSLRFASLPSEVQNNFTEIFTKTFLSEFFDYDYGLAVALATELSIAYRGDPARVRRDFMALAGFCRDSKGLDLPVRLCSEYAIKMARLSEFFPHGVALPFLQLYNRLRSDKEIAMDIKGSLSLSYLILKNGPWAVDNFFRGYSFATETSGLNYGRKQALSFALRMAKRSFEGKQPPTQSSDFTHVEHP